MIETITFNGKEYPIYQAQGNAAQFCRPFAEKLCKGVGYDIGYCEESWKLPGSIGIDLNLNNEYHAMNLPDMSVDFIHASHMAEHYIGNLAELLEYWVSKLHSGGVLFLYLPDYSQEYWRFWYNRKHIHTLTPDIMKDLLNGLDCFKRIFVSNVDLNNSFICAAEKK